MDPGQSAAAGAHSRAHLEALAARPNTIVYEPTYASVTEPWHTSRLRPVLKGLTARVLAYPLDTPPDSIREACRDDPETRAFAEQHPRLYAAITDRPRMADAKYRGVVTALLHLRGEVEQGTVRAGPEADAMATRRVLAALGAPLPPA